MGQMARGNGISNLIMDNFLEKVKDDDLKKNFMCLYSSNWIKYYTNFFEIIKQKDAKYQFAILNTSRENEPQMHWWVWYLYKKYLLLFDSFGLL